MAGRFSVYTDADMHGPVVEKWLDEGRSFPGLVWGPASTTHE